MTPDLKVFIPGLIEAWNSHNLEEILSRYSDDFELTSPVAKLRLGLEDGVIRGKAKVREWWRRVLDKVPDLNSELVNVAQTANSTVAMIFKSSHHQKTVVSVYTFNADGKICKEVYYD